MNKRININLVILLVRVTTCMAQQTTIYTIGDSTMANKENAGENPEYGWGQVLRPFFKENVSVVNRAVNERSSKSFITEGRWEAILEILKEGDFVFIQFGYNDQKTISPDRYTNPHVGYRHNLIKYVLETRGKGAKPILISSIVRRSFNEHGTLIDTHGDYPLETRLVALEYNVPFIDLQYLSEQLEESYGMEGSKKLHLHIKPGENSYYPDGRIDNTHLSLLGATEIAKLAVKEIKTKVPDLVGFIR